MNTILLLIGHVVSVIVSNKVSVIVVHNIVGDFLFSIIFNVNRYPFPRCASASINELWSSSHDAYTLMVKAISLEAVLTSQDTGAPSSMNLLDPALKDCS